MARKPKGFGQPLNSQRQEKDQQKALNKLQRRVQRGPLGDKIAGLIANPKGQDKMSEVLQAFVEPYKDFARNKQQQEKLLSIAMLAWNLALLPPDQQQSRKDQMIEGLCAGQGRRAKQDTREILDDLITRKQSFFADNKRYIVDFQLQDMGQSYHLSVASTLSPQSAASP